MIKMIGIVATSLSAACIFYDLTQNKVGKIPSEKGFFNLHAGGWALAALFLWIVALPAYLIKRSALVKKAVEHPVETSRVGLKLALLLIAGVVMILIRTADLPVDTADSAPAVSEAKSALVPEKVARPETPSSTVSLGLGKDEIIAGIEDWLPAFDSSPLHDGRQRLMAKTHDDKALTLIELIGDDAERPYRVSLMMFMPNDAPALLIGNMAVYGAVTKNIFPGWDGNDRVNWLTKSIEKLMNSKTDADSETPDIERTIGDKTIRVSAVKMLGAVSVTIQHKDAPK